MNKSLSVGLFVFCTAMTVYFAAAVFLNWSYLKRPLFQKETSLESVMSAKYEKDGNFYIIDQGVFRLLCMNLDGKIKYSINIDKMKEYMKIFDCTADEKGNLYVYMTELEYDALLTKRDLIRQYDSNGKFVKDIFIVDYEGIEDRPHAFQQFNSLRYNEGILTFSRVRRDGVTLYSYDTFREKITSSEIKTGDCDYYVAMACVRDFDNYIYSTRRGDIFEVKNGGEPDLRASFEFSPENGGIIPWFLTYGQEEGCILFYDMASGVIRSVGIDGGVVPAVPIDYLEAIMARGEIALATGFGYSNGVFSGVLGNVTWLFKDGEFKEYNGKVLLSAAERAKIVAAQISLVFCVLSFLFGVYIFFVFIQKGYVSLFIKQALIIIPATIIAFVVFYNIVFDAMSKRLNDEMFKVLITTISLGSELINEKDFNKIKSTKDYGGEIYSDINKILKTIVNDNSEEWSKLYYAALYTGYNLEYYVMLSNDETNLFRPASNILEDYSEDLKMLKSGKITSGILDYIDGTWAYANVGVWNNYGEFWGVLEIGFDTVSYQRKNLSLKKYISIIAALMCILILFLLTVAVSIIVSRIRKTTTVFVEIGNGNYAARSHYFSRDEFGDLSRWLNGMAEKLQKQFVYIDSMNKSTIRFVPEQFMEYLGVKDITKLKLGASVQRNLTVLFFDIRFFSVNSEMMSAKENFLFINKVMNIAGPIFRRHNGFIDKYLGDAAMVLFDRAADAVHAGIDLYRTIVLNKDTSVKIGGDGINIGVGIHSGSVMMGIVGEQERLSSTVISKHVNMASRLESLTKQTGSGMLISRDTMDQIKDEERNFQFRFAGIVRPAAVNEVVGVFDILDALNASRRKKRLETKRVFESGIRKYHTEDYGAACERFEAVLKADPGDICAANCLSEARKHLENPALPSVFVFSKK